MRCALRRARACIRIRPGLRAPFRPRVACAAAAAARTGALTRTPAQMRRPRARPRRCYNRTTCAARWAETPQLMSSLTWPLSLSLGGLFESNAYKSPLAGANLAYVSYCTSDAYVGDAGASDDSLGWAFRGAHVVPAVIQALISDHGMSSTGGPERLLLGGCGSGGAGALFNLDYVPSLVPANLNVHGLLDSALAVDIVPMAPGVAMPLQQQTFNVLKLANASGRVWPACAAQYPGADVAWKCLYGQYRLPFVRVSYLLAQPQYDAVQLQANEGGGPPYRAGTPAGRYAQAFGALVQKQADGLPLGDQTGSAVFSPACYTGCLTADAALFSVRASRASRPQLRASGPDARARSPQLAVYPPAGTASAAPMTLADALRSWYFENMSPLRIVEACATPGFACGAAECANVHLRGVVACKSADASSHVQACVATRRSRATRRSGRSGARSGRRRCRARRRRPTTARMHALSHTRHASFAHMRSRARSLRLRSQRRLAHAALALGLRHRAGRSSAGVRGERSGRALAQLGRRRRGGGGGSSVGTRAERRQGRRARATGDG